MTVGAVLDIDGIAVIPKSLSGEYQTSSPQQEVLGMPENGICLNRARPARRDACCAKSYRAQTTFRDHRQAIPALAPVSFSPWGILHRRFFVGAARDRILGKSMAHSRRHLVRILAPNLTQSGRGKTARFNMRTCLKDRRHATPSLQILFHADQQSRWSLGMRHELYTASRDARVRWYLRRSNNSPSGCLSALVLTSE